MTSDNRAGIPMTKKIALTAAVCLVSAFSSACFEFESKNSLGPTASGLSTLAGVWTSGNVIPSASTCTDFKWDVKEQSTTSASGSFSATCAGQLKLNGTARGTLDGSSITWKADGTATASDLPSCDIHLNG